MVNHSIAERCGTDLAPFWFVDVEIAIGSWPILVTYQLLLKSQLLALPIEIELSGQELVSFATSTFLVGSNKVIPRDDLGPKVTICFGHTLAQKSASAVSSLRVGVLA